MTFPLQNLLPSLFVYRIMNRYDGPHILRMGIMFFTEHGVKELLFRRIDPVAIRILLRLSMARSSISSETAWA